MMDEKNQASKPWGFDSPIQELHCGIQNSPKKEVQKFTDLQDRCLSWKLLKMKIMKMKKTKESLIW